MNLSLDYDDTYTRDPKAWNAFIMIMQASGHKVYLVTWRNVQESNNEIRQLSAILDGVYFTDRKAKAKYMFENHNIIVDVWIDDNPSAILKSMEPNYGGTVWE